MLFVVVRVSHCHSLVRAPPELSESQRKGMKTLPLIYAGFVVNNRIAIFVADIMATWPLKKLLLWLRTMCPLAIKASWLEEGCSQEMVDIGRLIIHCHSSVGYQRARILNTSSRHDICTEVQKLWKQFDKHDNFKIERWTQISRSV